MRQHTQGQSLVEMAFMLPILLVVLFGIIDMGYYIFGYATVYQSARNASEAAAQLPPFESRLANLSEAGNDDCITTILNAAQEDAVMFPDLQNFVEIRYPDGSSREIGQQIEVAITYDIEPLTPLFQFVSIGNEGVMTVRSVSRRSIESLGNNPNYANGVACQPYE